MRKFSFYENYYMALTYLDDETAGRVIKAVGAYMFNDTEPTLTGSDDAVFTAMRMQLDTSKRRAAAGKQGGSVSK